MLQRLGARVMTLSGLATGLTLIAAAAYLALFALSGGLQQALATDAPPAWALSELEFLSGIVVLYVLAAVVFTLSLALVQLHLGPWWAVIGGLVALVAGAGLLVAGSQAGEARYAVIDTLGFLGIAGYMLATNVVGLRARRISAVMAGTGLGAGLLPLAATLAGGLAGVSFLALALMMYAAWAVWLGVAEWRGPQAAQIQPALQSQPADR